MVYFFRVSRRCLSPPIAGTPASFRYSFPFPSMRERSRRLLPPPNSTRRPWWIRRLHTAGAEGAHREGRPAAQPTRRGTRSGRPPMSEHAAVVAPLGGEINVRAKP